MNSLFADFVKGKISEEDVRKAFNEQLKKARSSRLEEERRSKAEQFKKDEIKAKRRALAEAFVNYFDSVSSSPLEKEMKRKVINDIDRMIESNDSVVRAIVNNSEVPKAKENNIDKNNLKNKFSTPSALDSIINNLIDSLFE